MLQEANEEYTAYAAELRSEAETDEEKGEMASLLEDFAKLTESLLR